MDQAKNILAVLYASFGALAMAVASLVQGSVAHAQTPTLQHQAIEHEEKLA